MAEKDQHFRQSVGWVVNGENHGAKQQEHKHKLRC